MKKIDQHPIPNIFPPIFCPYLSFQSVLLNAEDMTLDLKFAGNERVRQFASNRFLNVTLWHFLQGFKRGSLGRNWCTVSFEDVLGLVLAPDFMKKIHQNHGSLPPRPCGFMWQIPAKNKRNSVTEIAVAIWKHAGKQIDINKLLPAPSSVKVKIFIRGPRVYSYWKFTPFETNHDIYLNMWFFIKYRHLPVRVPSLNP